jgi:hypothetical protein
MKGERLENCVLVEPRFTTARQGDLIGGSLRLSVNTAVAAAGSDDTDGALLADGITHVTGANATKGVVLPQPQPGMICIIKNADAANAVLKVYPGSGAAINALTATTGALSMAAKTSALFFAISSTQWFTLPLLPS